MTYGFKFLNNYDDTVLDDSSVKPWFLEQANYIAVEDITTKFAGVLNQTDQDGLPFTNFSPPETDISGGTGSPHSISSWTVYKVTYRTPADYNCFVLFNLPVNNSKVYYNCHNPVSFASPGTAGGVVELFAYVPNTWSATVADIPKAYIFVADPIPNSKQSTGYGVKLFNQSVQCMYDSGNKHFQPTAYPNIIVSNDFNSPRNYTTSFGSYIPSTQTAQNEYASTNSAWLLPLCRWVWVYPDSNGDWYNNYWEVLYRRTTSGNQLQTAEAATFRAVSAYTDRPGMYYGPNSYLGGGSSVTDLQSMVVDATPLDQGYVPPSLPQSFTLTKDKAGISEAPSYTDNRITITLRTVSVANGTVIPFTITGIQAADILPMSGFTSTLTGNFLVVDNVATQTIQAVNDTYIEGTETATLSLNNGKASISFTISDFISYSLSSYMSPEEGQSISVTLTTQGIANGSTVPYTVTGIAAADLTVGSLTGNFTITNNTGSLEFRFARDVPFEYETMRISVNNGATFLDIPITDVPSGNEVLTISPSTFNTTSTTNISITGGTPSTSFEFIILPTGTDPVYAWNNRWKTEYAGTVGTAYFDENGEYYNSAATGNDFGGVGNWTLWIFTSWTKNFRSANVIVTLPQTFSITGTDGTKGPITLNEGGTGYFKVTTSNVANGTIVYPKLINTTLSASDYTNSAASGVAVQNNVANFNITFAADTTTEGSEYGELVVQYPNGTTKDSYGQITVADTSLTPAGYSVSRYLASINENGFQIFTISMTNVPYGTQLWWDISGTGITTNDIQYVYHDAQDGEGLFTPSGGSTLNNTFTTNGSSTYQVMIYPRSDLQTEGTETATFNLRTGYSGGPSVASISFNINDTSTAPAYNESVTIVSDAYGDYIVELNNYMTITVSGGAPNTTFYFATTNYGDPQPTSFTGGPVTLNSSGSWTNYITGATAQGSQTIGDKQLWFKFTYDNNVRSARFKVVYDAGTTNGGQYCVGTTLTQNYNDGHGGTYAQTVQANSSSCGAVTLYTPVASQSSYYYYLATNTYDVFQVSGAKPNTTVRFSVISGIYAGQYYDRTANASGVATFDPGVGAYTAGTYSCTITFPGNESSYNASYRTLPINWIVVAGGGGTSLTVSNYSLTKTAGWEANIDAYGTPSAAYDGLRVHGTDSVSGTEANGIDKSVSRTFTTNVACTISYRLTMQSETNYDFGYFYIDGVEKLKESGLEGDGVNGTGAYLTMSLAAGTHTVRIRYTKDGSLAYGSDCAFGEYSLAV